MVVWPHGQGRGGRAGTVSLRLQGNVVHHRVVVRLVRPVRLIDVHDERDALHTAVVAVEGVVLGSEIGTGRPLGDLNLVGQGGRPAADVGADLVGGVAEVCELDAGGVLEVQECGFGSRSVCSAGCEEDCDGGKQDGWSGGDAVRVSAWGLLARTVVA